MDSLRSLGRDGADGARIGPDDRRCAQRRDRQQDRECDSLRDPTSPPTDRNALTGDSFLRVSCGASGNERPREALGTVCDYYRTRLWLLPAATPATALATLSIYVASKSAVDGLTRVPSKELGPKNIRVNALSPGATETEGAHAAGVMGTEFEKYLIANTPLGRFGQPDESRAWPSFLPRMMRAGSPERSSSRAAATNETTSGEHEK
jgi:NAD(P)-dependent dehydrogenase (short-subunit alcohol dehydrogenase family)